MELKNGGEKIIVQYKNFQKLYIFLWYIKILKIKNILQKYLSFYILKKNAKFIKKSNLRVTKVLHGVVSNLIKKTQIKLCAYSNSRDYKHPFSTFKTRFLIY